MSRSYEELVAELVEKIKSEFDLAGYFGSMEHRDEAERLLDELAGLALQ